MRSNGKNGKNGKTSVKGLVLASVFMECFLRERKLTVSELLVAHPILNSHYGRRPHVLSNVLLRYKKLGLLYREKDHVRGHPYRYNLTEKGFNRLRWMSWNCGRYLYRGVDLFSPLGLAFVYVLEKKRLEMTLRNLRRLQKKVAAAGLAKDSAEAETLVQNTEVELKVNYNETTLSEILTMLREKYKVLYEERSARAESNRVLS